MQFGSIRFVSVHINLLIQDEMPRFFFFFFGENVEYRLVGILAFSWLVTVVLV